MRLSRHGSGIAWRLLAAATLAGLHGNAIAQTQELAASSDIVVVAPRTLPPPGKRGTFSGAPEIVATVRIPLLFGDLDLSKPEDSARLMLRVDRVARDACRHLDRLYPLVRDPECVARAVAGATPAARAAIAAKQ